MQPGMLGSGVSNDGDIMRMLADQQRQINELRAANPFAPMGMVPGPNSMTFSGSVIVNGAETVNGPSTFNGDMLINGNLAVPAGSITNGALQNPIVTGSVGTSQSNILFDGTHRLYATSNIAVPAGYTNATVLCMATAYGYNGTTSADFLAVQAYGGNGAGGTAPQPAAANGGSAATAGNAINTFTGLSGGTIQVGAYVYTNGGNWGTNASNICNVNAVVIFTR